MAEQVLSDVKVLDLTWYIAGPYCTKMFADYGADVLKIEKPPEGDPARRIGPFLNDDPHPEKSLLFSHLNLNKRGITLNLKSETGKKIFKELVGDADILVENFSPGVMGRLGLDYETLKKINPRLIMTGISNFGQYGPYRDFKVSELVLSGMMDQYSHGNEGREPLKMAGNCEQYQAGHMATVATIAAYWLQLNEGIGQYIDVSMQETMTADIDHRTLNLLDWAYSGEVAIFRQDPRAGTSALLDITPTGVYPTKDGFIRAAGGIIFWPRFAAAFPDIGAKYTWPDDVLNMDNKGVVDAFWYPWCLDRTKQEIMEYMQKFKYFTTAINTPIDVIESPQLKERGFWVEVEHPVSGKQIYPGNPLKSEDPWWQVRMPAPLLGQHNEEFLCDKLGYSKDDLVKLREAGVI